MVPSRSRANASSVDADKPSDKEREIGSTRSFKGPDAEVTDNDFSLPNGGRAIPQTISRFQIRRLLGDGGFGSVYLAYDPKLHREIALKIPRMASLTDEDKQKFLAEARNAGQLKHPHVITIHDVGDSAESGVFIVMEYVEGETLARRLSRGKLGVREAIRVCSQVADAMHHAHGLHIYHRDLKPANILIDRAGNARVCDFGLALHEDDQREHRGEVSGTRAYMSPEQIQGNVHLLDGRTDIWSLGVILYEGLSDRRPFRGENWAEIREDILTRDPRPLRQIDDSIPAELDTLCRQALRRDPADRLPAAIDFRERLRVIERRQNRKPIRMVAGVCGIIALLAVAAIAVHEFYPRPGERNSPDRPRHERPGLALADGDIPPNRSEPDPVAPEFAQGRSDLLSQAPTAAFLNEKCIFTFSKEPRQFVVDSPDWSLFSCGTYPQETGLDIAIRPNESPGIAGGFWGLHPEPAPNGAIQDSVLLVSLKRISEDPGAGRIYLRQFTIAKTPNGKLNIIRNREISKATTRLDWTKIVDFKLSINNGRLHELRVQDRTVLIPETAAKVNWSEFATGLCGFATTGGRVTFTRALLDTQRKDQ